MGSQKVSIAPSILIVTLLTIVVDHTHEILSIWKDHLSFTLENFYWSLIILEWLIDIYQVVQGFYHESPS